MRTLVSYESRLSQNSEWALTEASLYFDDRGDLRRTFHRITTQLEEHKIPYAVAGTLALFAHGYRRFTENIDLLVTADSFAQIIKNLTAFRCVLPFPKGNILRDTETGVKIRFLITGQFPGDGKPKPVEFPHPTAASTNINGINYLSLPTLIQLKLASGMSSPERLRDLADVQEAIKTLRLTREFADKLSSPVRHKFVEIWNGMRSANCHFLRRWDLDILPEPMNSLGQLIDATRATGNAAAVELLKAMEADGVLIDSQRVRRPSYVWLVTDNPDVAAKYDMHEESEFLEP